MGTAYSSANGAASAGLRNQSINDQWSSQQLGSGYSQSGLNGSRMSRSSDNSSSGINSIPLHAHLTQRSWTEL